MYIFLVCKCIHYFVYHNSKAVFLYVCVTIIMYLSIFVCMRIYTVCMYICMYVCTYFLYINVSIILFIIIQKLFFFPLCVTTDYAFDYLTIVISLCVFAVLSTIMQIHNFGDFEVSKITWEYFLVVDYRV